MQGERLPVSAQQTDICQLPSSLSVQMSPWKCEHYTHYAQLQAQRTVRNSATFSKKCLKTSTIPLRVHSQNTTLEPLQDLGEFRVKILTRRTSNSLSCLVWNLWPTVSHTSAWFVLRFATESVRSIKFLKRHRNFFRKYQMSWI